MDLLTGGPLTEPEKWAYTVCTTMAKRPRRQRSERLHLRLSSEDRSLFEQAARQRRMTLTELIVQAARERAEEIILDARELIVSKKTWDWLQKRLEEPARPNERLRRLMLEPSVVERGDL